VTSLQISGRGSLKIQGTTKSTFSGLISRPWQSADSRNVAATNVLDLESVKFPEGEHALDELPHLLTGGAFQNISVIS